MVSIEFHTPPFCNVTKTLNSKFTNISTCGMLCYVCSHHFGKSAGLEEVAHDHSLLPDGDPVQVEGEGMEMSPPDQLVTQPDPFILKRKLVSLLQPRRRRKIILCL